MIVSTSSYKISMNDELYELVEDVVTTEFRNAERVVQSVDVRLEAIRFDHDITTIKATVRVDLYEGQRFDIERLDDELETAVQQSARAAASSVRRYTNRATVLKLNPPHEIRVSLEAYSTASV